MHARGKTLLRFLAVLLLVQWTAALEPCMRSLARIATAQAVELCSPAGDARAILVDQDGKPLQQAMHAGGCPLCRVASPAALPVEPVAELSLPAAHAMPVQAVVPAGLPPTPPRGPPQQPRAPPIA
jgi:hypothetical protein